MARDGTPSGGRPKGSRNKNTMGVMRQLMDMGCDPFANLAKIANGEKVNAMIGLNKDLGDIIVEDVTPTVDQQLAANRILSEYCAPKLKAVELSGDADNPVESVVTVELTPEAIKQLEENVRGRYGSLPESVDKDKV